MTPPNPLNISMPSFPRSRSTQLNLSSPSTSGPSSLTMTRFRLSISLHLHLHLQLLLTKTPPRQPERNTTRLSTLPAKSKPSMTPCKLAATLAAPPDNPLPFLHPSLPQLQWQHTIRHSPRVQHLQEATLATSVSIPLASSTMSVAHAPLPAWTMQLTIPQAPVHPDGTATTTTSILPYGPRLL